MKIALNRKHSVDGLGVKRWKFKLGDFTTLYVFDRPYSLANHAWLLRVDHADGRTLEVHLADTRQQAKSLAEGIARYYCNFFTT